MDTINANITPYSKFITLTTRDTCLDLKTFLTWFKSFCRQFKRKFGYGLPYIGITERQKKRGIKEGNAGSWHIHLAVFIQHKLDLKLLCSCWTRGHLDIQLLYHFSDIGRYMMKYLTKDNADIGLNKKMILKSHNLVSPACFTSYEVVVVPNYDYTISYNFYQGNLNFDLENNCFDEQKMNHCTIYEIHHIKELSSVA